MSVVTMVAHWITGNRSLVCLCRAHMRAGCMDEVLMDCRMKMAVRCPLISSSALAVTYKLSLHRYSFSTILSAEWKLSRITVVLFLDFLIVADTDLPSRPLRVRNPHFSALLQQVLAMLSRTVVHYRARTFVLLRHCLNVQPISTILKLSRPIRAYSSMASERPANNLQAQIRFLHDYSACDVCTHGGESCPNST